MSIGARIRRFRIAAGLSQQDLGEKVDMSRAAISLYESDDREPDIETQGKLAEALEVTVSDLLGIGPTEELPEETVAFARQLEALDPERRAAVMEFVRKTLLDR